MNCSRADEIIWTLVDAQLEELQSDETETQWLIDARDDLMKDIKLSIQNDHCMRLKSKAAELLQLNVKAEKAKIYNAIDLQFVSRIKQAQQYDVNFIGKATDGILARIEQGELGIDILNSILLKPRIFAEKNDMHFEAQKIYALITIEHLSQINEELKETLRLMSHEMLQTTQGIETLCEVQTLREILISALEKLSICSELSKASDPIDFYYDKICPAIFEALENIGVTLSNSIEHYCELTREALKYCFEFSTVFNDKYPIISSIPLSLKALCVANSNDLLVTDISERYRVSMHTKFARRGLLNKIELFEKSNILNDWIALSKCSPENYNHKINYARLNELNHTTITSFCLKCLPYIRNILQWNPNVFSVFYKILQACSLVGHEDKLPRIYNHVNKDVDLLSKLLELLVDDNTHSTIDIANFIDTALSNNPCKIGIQKILNKHKYLEFFQGINFLAIDTNILLALLENTAHSDSFFDPKILRAFFNIYFAKEDRIEYNFAWAILSIYTSLLTTEVHYHVATNNTEQKKQGFLSLLRCLSYAQKIEIRIRKNQYYTLYNGGEFKLGNIKPVYKAESASTDLMHIFFYPPDIGAQIISHFDICRMKEFPSGFTACGMRNESNIFDFAFTVAF